MAPIEVATPVTNQRVGRLTSGGSRRVRRGDTNRMPAMPPKDSWKLGRAIDGGSSASTRIAARASPSHAPGRRPWRRVQAAASVIQTARRAGTGQPAQVAYPIAAATAPIAAV